MANIKSAKRIEPWVQTERNTMIKSALKTKVKKFETALVTGDVAEAKVTYRNVVKALDMAVTKGILHIKGIKKSIETSSKLNALDVSAQ